MLVDRANISVKAGDGGAGSASFRREKFVQMGGPDGGDGGRGGDVRLHVRPSLTSLLPFQFNQSFKAEAGRAGQKRKRHGRAGKHLIIDVPPGTIVWDDETNEILADLTEADEVVTIARGGRGGLGNTHFRSATRQAPKLAELGEPGEERKLRLELRLIADVGLVGLPNAGKSTLLSIATSARPKVADYPFTTLEPNLGVAQVGGRYGRTLVLADIPGLIEGAASGAGLGHEFLRHVQRTKVLVHLLDTAGGLEGRDPMEDFASINAELELFDSDLRAKPMLVALNKLDLAEARDNEPRVRDELLALGLPTYAISAATGEGVEDLVVAIAVALGEVEEAERERAKHEKPQERRVYTIGNVSDRAWEARRVGQEYVVTGIGIERFTKMTNFSLDEGVDRFQRVLETSGISAELERLGIDDGDTVRVADRVLVWGDPEPEAPRSVRLTRRQRTRARIGDDDELDDDDERDGVVESG